MNKAIEAVFFVPRYCDMYPPATQANPPKPMIRKDKIGMLNFDPGFSFIYAVSIKGTKAQNAYNSHI